MTLDEFIQVCDRFTNKKLFLCDARGILLKDREGNLTKINYDNVEAGGTPVELPVSGPSVSLGQTDYLIQAVDDIG